MLQWAKIAIYWKAWQGRYYVRLVLRSVTLGGALAALCGIAILVAIKAGMPIPVDPARVKGSVETGLFIGMMGMLGLYRLRVNEVNARLNWLARDAEVVANNLSWLHERNIAETSVEEQAPKADRWPWGSYHTEMLGHVEAAARKWWLNYDPARPDTAPTNETVSAWLCHERGVSKDKAKSIASILRADGLRTGPRG